MTTRRDALSGASLSSSVIAAQNAGRGALGPALYKTSEARIKPTRPRLLQKRFGASVAASRQIFLSGALTAELSSPQKSSLIDVNFLDPPGGRGKFVRLPLGHGGFLLVQ